MCVSRKDIDGIILCVHVYILGNSPKFTIFAQVSKIIDVGNWRGGFLAFPLAILFQSAF